jgi:hypothetical protein
MDSSFRLAENTMDMIKVGVNDSPPAPSAEIEINFNRVGLTNQKEMNKHCNFAGDECWNIRVYPTILSFNQTEGGSDKGGQPLEILGTGFTGKNITATVANENCRIVENTNERIVCYTSFFDASAKSAKYPLQHGLSVQRYDVPYTGSSPTLDQVTQDLEKNGESYLIPTFEMYEKKVKPSFFGRAAKIIDGWFTAPESGQYRFYLSCTDECSLELDSQLPYSPSIGKASSWREGSYAPSEIARSTTRHDWRAYFKNRK